MTRDDPPPAVDTVDDLAVELRRITEQCAATDDRAGYFAALYLLMTGRVRDGLRTGQFHNGASLERLACHFAARYLAALERDRAGEQPPASWAIVFEAADRWRPIILQHLLLGMNAHINFDLGIAAAEVTAGTGLDRVREDFFAINDVLAELLEDVQVRLAAVSPWMGALDAAGGRKDEAVVNFSMRKARDAAWRVAERHVVLLDEERDAAERALDEQVAQFAQVVLRPGRLITAAALCIRLREREPVADVIEALSRPVEG